jgi:hypothetical protein
MSRPAQAPVVPTPSGAGLCFADKFRCRKCLCIIDTLRCRTCLCMIGTFRCSKGSSCSATSRCSSGPCGVDTSRSCTGSCCPGKSKCSLGSYGVDTSRCSKCLVEVQCSSGFFVHKVQFFNKFFILFLTPEGNLSITMKFGMQKWKKKFRFR